MNSIKLCALGVVSLLTFPAMADSYIIDEGLWHIEMNNSTGRIDISHNGKAVFNDVSASATYNVYGETTTYSIDSHQYGKTPEIQTEEISDNFGDGKSYVFSYAGDKALMKQSFNFYPGLPYMLVQLSLEGNGGQTLQSNNLRAFAINETSMPLNGASNKVVWVPFDNDGHVKYEVYDLKREVVSHEVGYVFDGDSRRGIVAGSVDHDTWKSGVTISGTSGYKLEKFECLSGLTNYYTRDALPHGKVKGTTVSSARFFVGVYDDWREGLNEFGDANNKVVEKAEWLKGNPMGWNSWGVQQNYVNYDGVLETAMFIKERLYDSGFHDKDGQTVISLDSFAEDNIPLSKIYSLGTKIFKDGTYRDGLETKEGTNQILGQYCGPLVAWSWTMGSKVPGTGLNGTPDYTYNDIALRVNGKTYAVTSNSGYAVDPTHPGVRANIEYFMKQYATNGTKYIKADFLNNGIIEGDKWYDPEITTGVQAYNYGMKILYEEASKYGIYIVESISPIFPYQYAHGRRTCCDRFSQIGETEYVMNSITYGWWTDKLYTVNDPDQLVLHKAGYNANETWGENRARASSGMAAGAYIFGDNFSDKVLDNNGRVVGYPDKSIERALEIMGNEEINAYVRNHTGSFMPVNGHKPSSSQSAENIFMRKTDDALYLMVFNYGSIFASNGSVTYARLGINPEDISEIKELWTGEISEVSGDEFDYSVPAKDVRVYKMTLAGNAMVESIKANDSGKDAPVLLKSGNDIYKMLGASLKEVRVYDISGNAISVNPANGNESLIDMTMCPKGIYLLQSILTDGGTHIHKIVK